TTVVVAYHFYFFQAEDGIRDFHVTGVQTCALPISPRKGCDSDFLNQVSRFKPGRMVYVSCDPATQARDLKRLLEMGYQVEQVQQIGRASCRERVYMSGVAGALKEKEV